MSQPLAAPKRTARWLVPALLLLITLGSGLAQPLNPSAPDGWFWTKDKLFHVFRADAGNFTPIGVPAYGYWLLEHVLAAAGVESLETQIQAAVVLHQLLLFSSGLALLLIGVVVGMEAWLGIAAVGFVLLVESTWIPQQLLSENFLIPLNTWMLYAVVRCRAELRDPAGAPGRWSAIGGVLLGFAAGIKPTVVMALPGIVLFLASAKARRREWLVVSASAVLACALTLCFLMGANKIRYGRFELSDTLGRHLWNIMRLEADTLLGSTPEYTLLLASFSSEELAAMRFWDLKREMAESDSEALRRHAASGFAFERFLRPMVVRGIRENPRIFLGLGVRQFATYALNGPAVVGYRTREDGFQESEVQSPRLNPLGRREWLPPLAPRAYDVVDDLLARARRTSERHFQTAFGLVVLAVPLLGLLVGLGQARRRSGRTALFSPAVAERAEALLWLQLFLLWCFFSNRFLMCQVEKFTGRYAVVFLEAACLCAGLLLGLCASIAHSARQAKMQAR